MGSTRAVIDKMAADDKTYLTFEASLHPGKTMPRKRTPFADAYEEWLKNQPAAPATRGQKDRVEADVYEAWLRERVEKKQPKR